MSGFVATHVSHVNPKPWCWPVPGSRRALKRARATAGTTLPAAPGVSSCVSASVLRTSAAVSPDASAASMRASTARSGLRVHEAFCLNPKGLTAHDAPGLEQGCGLPRSLRRRHARQHHAQRPAPA